MAFQIKKATKEQAKLRLALIGLAGSGKTFSALAIATNLVPNGRVCVIDTERGSASLYAPPFAFDVIELESFAPGKYVEALEYVEAQGYDVCVIDSLTHAWSGKDGALEQVDKAQRRSGSGNSFTAWRDVTPQHNALVEAMLRTRMHLIATMRSKMEYVQEKDDKNKTTIRKVGLAPIQRDGMDYEFTVVGDMDLDHKLIVTKSRCLGAVDVGAVIDKPGEKLAHTLRAWLMSGAPSTRTESTPAPKAQDAALSTVASGTATELLVGVVGEGLSIVQTTEPVVEKTMSEEDRAFAEYIGAMQVASTQKELDKIANGPAKPTKPAPGVESMPYKLAMHTYKTRQAELEQLTKQLAEQMGKPVPTSQAGAA
jgi:hypothetical protein